MGVNILSKTVTRQRRGCDLNPGPSAPESSTLTTRLPSYPIVDGCPNSLPQRASYGGCAEPLPGLSLPLRKYREMKVCPNTKIRAASAMRLSLPLLKQLAIPSCKQWFHAKTITTIKAKFHYTGPTRQSPRTLSETRVCGPGLAKKSARVRSGPCSGI